MSRQHRGAMPLLILVLAALAGIAVVLALVSAGVLSLSPAVAIAGLVLVVTAAVGVVTLSLGSWRGAEPADASLDVAQTVVAELPDAVAVIDPDGSVRAANRRFGELLGSVGVVRQRHIADLLSSAGFPRSLVDAVAESPRLDALRAEPDRPGAPAYEATMVPLDRPGCEGCRMLVVRDVTQYKREQDELAHLATHDGLTGLANRRTLEEALERAIARAERGTHSVLVYIDIDRFKPVNDLHGHQRGDELLVAIAQVMSAHLRGGDLAARIGGDEFALLLEDIDDVTAAGVAGRLMLSTSGIPAPGSRGSHSVTLSIGLAALMPGDNAALALARADMAMYRAKQRGGDSVEAFDPTVDYTSEKRSDEHMLALVRDALLRDDVVVDFQPIVRLRDGLAVSHEALVRLRIEDRLVPPAEFLALAERHHLVSGITDRVLGRVLTALAERPDMRASVNVSRDDLGDPRFPSELAARLAGARISARRLTVEIPEAVATADPAHARSVVAELQNRGFRIALDAVGSGAASIELLRTLPVDRVKVDRRTVSERTDARNWLLRVDVIRQIAESRGISVIVQGVEDAATEQALRRLGVSYAQGSYFSPPVETPAQDAVFAV